MLRFGVKSLLGVLKQCSLSPNFSSKPLQNFPNFWKYVYCEHAYARLSMIYMWDMSLKLISTILFFRWRLHLHCRKHWWEIERGILLCLPDSHHAEITPPVLWFCVYTRSKLASLIFMAVSSFFSRTLVLGNRALCVDSSRITLTTTSARPLGKSLMFFSFTFLALKPSERSLCSWALSGFHSSQGESIANCKDFDRTSGTSKHYVWDYCPCQ